jgi:CDP-4-dehydro-6-deoxyglucose reductase
VRIRVSGSDLSFSAAPGQTLLDAALDASLNLPHSCKGGNCGACRARLLQGEIDYPNGPPLGLSDAEVADGYVLLCQARARTDLCIETLRISTPDQILTKRLPARIERAVPLSHDVMGLYLKLPAAEAFEFRAGQYIDVMLSGGRRRSFSIASPPHDSRLLELHVRRVEGGEFSAPLFDDERRGALLTIEGPLGQFAYRDGGSPMLLVGGGTGLAPLLSMMRHVVENGIERDISLYWGVRAERDLYAHAALEDLTKRARPGLLRYVPVLSEGSPEWHGRRGFVHQAVIEDVQTIEGYEVYAAGPPAMIEAVRRDFGRHGAAPDNGYFDSFDYAPDTLDRQRMSAVPQS